MTFIVFFFHPPISLYLLSSPLHSVLHLQQFELVEFSFVMVVAKVMEEGNIISIIQI